jgi:hypothetical protein
MRSIDHDPELLRKSANAAVHAAEQAWIHMQAEYAGRVPELMATLTAEGPYAYTIIPEVHADGGIKLPIIVTGEGIRQAYTLIRGASELICSEPLVEIRGTWYTFTEALNRGRLKGSDVTAESETVALFPSSTGKGITGELVWVRTPRSKLGRGPRTAVADVPEMQLRRRLLALHDRYVNALRAADIDGLLETMDDSVQAAVRDYVSDTGTLTSLDGKEAHRGYYRSLFNKFDVLSAELLDRVVQEWYVFAELRVTLRQRGGGTVAFHTAEYFVPAHDGRFIARIGHGTDPA